MKLNTGKMAFPIEFDNGDTDVIYFNPNDPDLAKRLTEYGKKVSDRFRQLSEDIALKQDGTPEDVGRLNEVLKMQEILYEELDVAFGAPVSKVVFKYCSAFAIVDGMPFVTQFMHAITKEIEKVNKKINAEVEKKMKKHLAKYIK